MFQNGIKRQLKRILLGGFFLIQSMLSVKSDVQAEFTLPPCAHLVECGAIYAGTIAGCASLCIVGGVWTGGAACVACLVAGGGWAANIIEYCIKNSEACGNSFFPVDPNPQPNCSSNCVSCCQRSADTFCSSAGDMCKNMAYKNCFPSCSCPGGHNFPPDRPAYGENLNCNSRGPLPPKKNLIPPPVEFVPY